MSLVILISRFLTSFSHSHKLHRAKFANLNDLTSLLSSALDGTSLLLGIGHLSQVLRIRPTQTRRELGNLLIVAPTRGGKGLLAVSQLLTWPHSVIINDIKGELFSATAGYRATLGPVFVLDPTGLGHRYDPCWASTPRTRSSPARPTSYSSQTRERALSSPSARPSCSLSSS